MQFSQHELVTNYKMNVLISDILPVLNLLNKRQENLFLEHFLWTEINSTENPAKTWASPDLCRVKT